MDLTAQSPGPDPKAPVRHCSFCGHLDSEHAYSDEHSQADWMNDDGSINYATHCHRMTMPGWSCLCPDWNGQGRPHAEPESAACGRWAPPVSP